MPMGRQAIAIAALLALGAPAAASAAPAGALPPDYYGVVTQDGAGATPGDLDTMRAGGVGSIRLLANWAAVEAERGSYDWTAVDEMLRPAVKRGLRPVLFLYGTPAWAANRDGHGCEGGGCIVYAPASPETRAAFAAFAAAAVRRYGPGGEFWTAPEAACPLPIVPVVCPDPEPPCRCSHPAPLRVWQIWNEQNSPKYHAPAVDVAGYAALLRATSAAIRAEDRRAEIVLGGMWGPNTLLRRGARRPVTPVSLYLKRLYRVRGIKRSFDAIAIHPYAANMRGVRAQMNAARRIVRRAGDRRARTWVTELGWASHGPAESPYVKGPSGQARLLTRTFRMLEQKRRVYRVRGVFWYAWRDKTGGGSICDWCANAGLRDNDGSAKPSWDAFVRIAR